MIKALETVIIVLLMLAIYGLAYLYAGIIGILIASLAMSLMVMLAKR